MIAFVFPGQGSQQRGMGQGLFDEVREYKAIEKDVDNLLGYSVREMCLRDAGNRLRETEFTQPCLYVVNALHYYKAMMQGMSPSHFAGHSLGEYNALLAAGVFDFFTGLQLVKKRGELMSLAKNGGMAAVIGLSTAQIATVMKESALSSLDIANFNSPSQTIVSGPIDDITRAGPSFQKAGARMYMPLPVSSAFHSRYVVDAARKFGDFLVPMTFRSPKMPVIANVTAQPYPSDDSESAKALLVGQIVSPVRWTQSIRYLSSQGATEFRELGPGTVLTRLVRQIQQEEDK